MSNDTTDETEEERIIEQLQAKSSMDYWWPKLRETDVNTPKTVQLDIAETQEFQDGLAMPVPNENELHDAIETVNGPPAFLRSDITSRKHRMGASRITELTPDATVVAGVVEQHHLSWGMPMPSSWYVREWLELYHEFKGWAYDHHTYATPIAAEVRTFILDGELHGMGFYWPKDAIRKPNASNWEQLWEEVRDTAMNDSNRDTLTEYAERVGEIFTDGYWSVDFALTENNQWYALDMARGELSFHPESVEKAVPDPREMTEPEVE